MRSMKIDHKLANVNFETVKYIVDNCLTNIFFEKSRPKNAKMAELGYFEIGCRKTAFWEKWFWNLWTLFLGFLWKINLKHFMHWTIPKRCVLGVFRTAQYISEVYFIWRKLLFTLLTSYGYNAFGCIYILFTLKKKKENNFLSPTLIFWGYVLERHFSRFLQKTKKPSFWPEFCFFTFL